MSDNTFQTYFRPEFENKNLGDAQNVDVERRMSAFERIGNINSVRKLSILLGLVITWEVYSRISGVEPLLFPSFSDSAAALWETIANGVMLKKVWVTLDILLRGYAAGLACAAVLLIWAALTRIGKDVLGALTAMFQPLPAISLLPLAMLWFGLGTNSLIFITIHSVLWAVALSTLTGFMGVSKTLCMVGRNYGLRGIPYIFKILVPAGFPSILIGLKVGWAFAWRTLIGAELVFGALSGSGGLGWMVYEKGENLDTSYVFAALFMVIVIGLLVENLIFRNIEIWTISKWGMQR